MDVDREQGIVQDQIGNIPLLILYDDHQQTVETYQRAIDGVKLVFQDALECDLIGDEKPAYIGIFNQTRLSRGSLRVSRWGKFQRP